jgi:hypothetical protein
MEKTEEETVAITVLEHKRLLRCRAILRALEAGGVDNWEWYGESLKDIPDED